MVWQLNDMKFWGQSTSTTLCLFLVCLHLAASLINSAQNHCNWCAEAESSQATLAHDLSETVLWCKSKTQLFWRVLEGLRRYCLEDLTSAVCFWYVWVRLCNCETPPSLYYLSKHGEIVWVCLCWTMSSSKTETKQHPFCSPLQKARGLALMSHVLMDGSHHSEDSAEPPLPKWILYSCFWRSPSYLCIYWDRKGVDIAFYLL